MIRFHLDENVHHGVARGLRLRGLDVTTTTDARLLEATDEGQFQYAVQQGRVFVTHDADFLLIAQYPFECTNAERKPCGRRSARCCGGRARH